MARDGWFDDSGTELFKNSIEKRSVEIQEYMKDGLITREEIAQQWEIIQKKLAVLEPKLSDELHAELTEIIIDIELATQMEDVNNGRGDFSSNVS